ncbi:hypothetical protein [Modestobacter sp. SSW1-42]|uniref:hypothetical protein n=1 Tax=Modestobacter sp. SSW1-42 TaxID=596372 RepID=UPI003987C94C
MPARRPGQRRARGDSSAAPSPVHQNKLFSVSTTSPRRPDPVVVKIDPTSAGRAAGLASDLAEMWTRKHDRGRTVTAKTDRLALLKFFTVLREADVVQWSQVSISLLEQAEHVFSTTSTLSLNWIWYCLAHLPNDSDHGRLSGEVRTFLQSPPDTPQIRRGSIEALPPAMLRDVLRAAMSDVAQAEHRIRTADWDGLGQPPIDALIRRHEIIAFYVLLCMEWGMSPDVVRTLSFDPTQLTSVQDWHDGEPKVKIRWYKERSRRGDIAIMMADKEWRAGSLLRRLREATRPVRRAAPFAWSAYPWICAEPVPTTGKAGAKTSWWRENSTTDHRFVDHPDGTSSRIELAFADRVGTLRQWCEQPRKPGLQIAIPDRYADPSSRLGYQAIRPAAKWAKFMASGKGLLLSELVDDNTVEVLSAHYLNSDVAMRDIGQAWAQVPGLAEEVARGLRPTALDRLGNVVSGQPIDDEVAATATSDNRVGASGCRDPYNSPLAGERSGSLCGAANRSCYFCPNSVVTPDDIPVMRAYLLLAEQAVTNMSPPEWRLHWGRTVTWICSVLPRMASDWESMPISDAGIFDLGLEAGPA